MEKESYNIDDILSEIKERIEQEKNKIATDFEIKEKGTAQEGTEVTATETAADSIELTSDEIAEEEPTEDLAFSITESDISDSAVEEPVVEEIAEEPEEPEVTEEPENTEEPEQEDAAEETDESEQEEAQPEEELPEGYVDLLAIAQETEEAVEEPEEEETVEKVSFFKTKKGRIIKRVIITLVVLILVLGVAAGFFIKNALDNMSENNQKPVEQEWKGMSQLIENFPEINEKEAGELSSLQDMIRDWYYNGAPCSSTHVLNVLLIGEDTRGTEILDDETRADAAIIASVNIDTKTITLTSILRDAYAYWENTPNSEESENEFGKINGAMAKSGINGYINCVEKLYKIDIDNYVIVNFDSFESIIDELGGVNLELTTAEINEINNHPNRYGNVVIEKSFEGDSGTMLLTGKQALAYCRIRYIDSDNARADRQKTCLYQIFNEVKEGSSVTQLKVVKALLPYVKTGFSSSEIISIAKYALKQDWLGYDVNMITVPYARINEKGAGGVYYGAWCWKADFPQDAYYMQTMLYGKSSITLAQQRVDILNCNLYGFYEESFVPCYATITNYNYGEVTTYESPEKDEATASD